jgi:hypothetical protein
MNESSKITESDINNLIKQAFTGNSGPKVRWMIFYGTKRQFNKFINRLKNEQTINHP